MFKYIAMGLGAALLLALGGLYWQTARLDRAQENIAVLKATARDNAALVDAQNAAIADLNRIEGERVVAMKAAGIRLAELATNLAAERAKRRKATETDYARPDCTAFLETDLASLCPAHAVGVRDAARRLPGN